MFQANIIYRGRVQGVGFRFTTREYARDLGLTGWVRNLPSAEVELFAEGAEKDIVELCRRIEKHFSGYIRHKQISFCPAAEKTETGFEIR
ncbi:MAG: acylphosphatase [Candidatus Omnitrophica bacterium]|nr:acylphosphatase [Candidatus Omnitrophota bacterium]